MPRRLERKARQVDQLQRLRSKVGEEQRAIVGRHAELARERAGGNGAEHRAGAVAHLRRVDHREKLRVGRRAGEAI